MPRWGCCGRKFDGNDRGVAMRLSARVDYALRAVCELAAAEAPRTVEQLSAAQRIPNKYLESILGELRRGGLLRSQRGPDGGYPPPPPAPRANNAALNPAPDGGLGHDRGGPPRAPGDGGG